MGYNDSPPRKQYLEKAVEITCGDRAAAYGPPIANLSNIATLWASYLTMRRGGDNVEISAEDVAWMMNLLKIARSVQPGVHTDNYIDAAAYSALAGECRAWVEGGTNDEG